jgi:hypothetical protein
MTAHSEAAPFRQDAALGEIMSALDDKNCTTAAADSALSLGLRYAALGMHVGPAHHITPAGICSCWEGGRCGKPGKHPTSEGWQQRATIDPEAIQAARARNPHANLFVATGRLCDVLDIDLPDLDAWQRQTGIVLPPTWHQRTGSGNHQLFFRARSGVGNRVKVPALPATDTRGVGGLAIVPPSRNARGAYSWIVAPWSCELAEWPAELLALVRPAPRPAPSLAPVPEGYSRVAPAWLHRLADDGAAAGERNAKLFWLACRCRALGLDEGEALAVLWRYGQNCSPAMDPGEVRRTWESSARHQGYEAARRLAPVICRQSNTMPAPERRPGTVLPPPTRRPGLVLEVRP